MMSAKKNWDWSRASSARFSQRLRLSSAIMAMSILTRSSIPRPLISTRWQHQLHGLQRLKGMKKTNTSITTSMEKTNIIKDTTITMVWRMKRAERHLNTTSRLSYIMPGSRLTSTSSTTLWHGSGQSRLFAVRGFATLPTKRRSATSSNRPESR